MLEYFQRKNGYFTALSAENRNSRFGQLVIMVSNENKVKQKFWKFEALSQ